MAFPILSLGKLSMTRWLTLGILVLVGTAQAADDPKISWKKTVIDTRFVAEGVAIGDVNHDGKIDILNGEFWYESPDWKPHRIRSGGPYKEDYRQGENNVYSQSFACWTEDINKDGWVDLIVIGFPGAPCHWYENPQNKEGNWKQHEIWHSACNETPIYADIFGKGQRVLLMGWQPKGKENEGQMAYFTPGADPTKTWEMHAISEPSVAPEIKDGKPVPNTGKIIPGTFKYAHGLGVGDVNGDGRNDVIIPNGWWEQPEKEDGKYWTWHAAPLGQPAADMYALDLDGDKKQDVVSSSAHGYGIWSYLQRSESAGKSTFVQKDLFPKLVSQTHAMHFVDINGDGVKDLVTGKRWWAHGPKGDADPNGAAKIFWLHAKKANDGTISFTPTEIDDDSGIGTQFVVDDINGDKLPDVIVSNKKGVFLIEQIRK
jgi:hypothetical protein